MRNNWWPAEQRRSAERCSWAAAIVHRTLVGRCSWEPAGAAQPSATSRIWASCHAVGLHRPYKGSPCAQSTLMGEQYILLLAPSPLCVVPLLGGATSSSPPLSPPSRGCLYPLQLYGAASIPCNSLPGGASLMPSSCPAGFFLL